MLIIFTSNANKLLRSPYQACSFVTCDKSYLTNSGLNPSDNPILWYLSLILSQLITHTNPKSAAHCAFPEFSTLNPRATPFSFNAPCVTLSPEAECFYPSMIRLNPSAEPFRSKTSTSCEVVNEKAISALHSTESFGISLCSISYNINTVFPVLDSSFNVDAPIFRPNNYKPIPCRIDFLPKMVRKQTTPLFDDAHNDIPNDSFDGSSIDILKDLRAKNQDRVIIGHLNVNSIRNKLEMLSNLVKSNIDIFLVSETKIDDSFPTSQFLIPGFSPPLRLDRNSYGGGLLLYVRDEIPAKLLICDIVADIECIPVEINLLKKKWLVYGTYNPKRGLISSHMLTIRKSLERFLPLYDNSWSAL